MRKLSKSKTVAKINQEEKQDSSSDNNEVLKLETKPGVIKVEEIPE